MLPISRSAESPTSVRGSTPSSRHRRALWSGGMSSRTLPPKSPATPIMTAVTSCSGWPQASTASAIGSASARGTEMSTSRASIWESAPAAPPEAMFASSRRASSWESLRLMVTGAPMGSGGGGDGGRRGEVDGGWHGRTAGARRGERVAIDDQRDPPVGQRGAARYRLPAGDRARQRPRDELSLADELID